MYLSLASHLFGHFFRESSIKIQKHKTEEPEILFGCFNGIIPSILIVIFVLRP